MAHEEKGSRGTLKNYKRYMLEKLRGCFRLTHEGDFKSVNAAPISLIVLQICGTTDGNQAVLLLIYLQAFFKQKEITSKIGVLHLC